MGSSSPRLTAACLCQRHWYRSRPSHTFANCPTTNDWPSQAKGCWCHMIQCEDKQTDREAIDKGRASCDIRDRWTRATFPPWVRTNAGMTSFSWLQIQMARVGFAARSVVTRYACQYASQMPMALTCPARLKGPPQLSGWMCPRRHLLREGKSCLASYFYCFSARVKEVMWGREIDVVNRDTKIKALQPIFRRINKGITKAKNGLAKLRWRVIFLHSH